MFASKSYTFVLLCLALACFVHAIGSNSNTGGNNYTWGTKGATDVLLAKEVITRNKSFLSTVSYTYTLPTQSGTAKTITYIAITDQKPKRGATAVITSGGVGSTTVTIQFTSERSSGIKSTVEIWASA